MVAPVARRVLLGMGIERHVVDEPSCGANAFVVGAKAVRDCRRHAGAGEKYQLSANTSTALPQDIRSYRKKEYGRLMKQHRERSAETREDRGRANAELVRRQDRKCS